MNQNNIQDIAFNTSNTFSIECNKTNIITLNEKDSQGNWIRSGTITSTDSTDQFTKVQWAHPQFGLLFAASSLHKTISFFFFSKTSITDSNWLQLSSIFTDHQIESFDFLGNSQCLKVVLVTLSGQAYVYESSDYSHSNWNCIWKAQVSLIGCSSVSTLKTEGFNELFIIGCHANPNNKSDPLLQIYGLSQKTKDYLLLSSLKPTSIGNSVSIVDVKWGYQLGKTCHYIAYTDTNNYIHFTSIKLKRDTNSSEYIAIETKLNSIQNKNKSIIRALGWNYIGTMLSAIDDSGASLIFARKSDSNEFILL